VTIETAQNSLAGTMASSSSFPPPLVGTHFPKTAISSGVTLVTPLIIALVLSLILIILWKFKKVKLSLVTFDSFSSTFLSIERVNDLQQQEGEAFTSSATSSGKINLKATQIVPHSTSFGGLMTVISVIVATAVCLELLLEYSFDLGVETTSMALSTTPSQPDLIQSSASLTISASATTTIAGGGGGGSCVIT